eukprot:SAG31_NODE_34105_length_336_cov_1.063291_2_plen_39_part_01
MVKLGAEGSYPQNERCVLDSLCVPVAMEKGSSDSAALFF